MMSHWSSRLTCLLPATRVTGSNPLGELMWNRDSPTIVVSLHWWPRRDWSTTRLCPQQLSLGPRADNVTVPLALTQLSCPGFTLAAGLPSGFTTVGCWGGGLWRACNLTMSHWSSGLTCLLPATRVTGWYPPEGLMWNWDSPVSVVSLHLCNLIVNFLNIKPLTAESVTFLKSWERLLLRALTFQKAESVNCWEC